MLEDIGQKVGSRDFLGKTAIELVSRNAVECLFSVLDIFWNLNPAEAGQEDVDRRNRMVAL